MNYAPKSYYSTAPVIPVDPKEVRGKILHLEAAMRELPQVEVRVEHVFAPGIYAREMHLPAGVTITGKLHKTEHLCVVSKGKAKVVSEFGEEIIDAPARFVTKIGTKRAIHALEDLIWTTFHVTDETDVDKIEETIIAKSYDELQLDAPQTLKLED